MSRHLANLEQIKALPLDFWIKIGGAILAVVVAVALYRWARKFNVWILVGGGLIVFFIFFANWVYNRTEPAFLTPFVDLIAPFFPTADYVRKDFDS